MKGAAFLDAHERCAHRHYWLTCEEFDAMAKAQGHACKLCGDATKPLVVDHDHALGIWAVRGLICQFCNSLLAQVDAGRWESSARVAQYLAEAWHLSQAPRTKPQTNPRRPRRIPAAVHIASSKPAMVMRSIRVPLKLWEQAKAKADERDENISDVVRAALQEYLDRK